MKSKVYIYSIVLFSSLLFMNCQEDEMALPPQAEAVFSASADQVAVGETIQFTNDSQNATAYLWSFGDGTTSKLVSPKKSYESSDIFLVSLVSTGAGGSTISNMEITVTPASSFTVEDPESLLATVPVQFNNMSLEATSYSWSFGDGTNSSSTEENPTHTYTEAGTYSVSLTAESAVGSHVFTQDILVGSAPQKFADLYYIDLGDEYVRSLALDGTGTVSDILNIAGMGGVGMAYDHVNQKVYFSDFNAYPLGNIWKMNPDGSELEAIASNIGDPYAIALDIDAGKIYWVDDDGNVSRANMDGSNPEIGFFTVAGAWWRAIALDVENSKMYVYDSYFEDLYEVNMDGTDPNIIVSGVYGYAISVDTVNDKIYFDDQNEELLKVANLDGSDVQTVDDNGTRIYGMHIDHEEGKLYWSGRDSGELYRANLDGTGKEVLKTGLSSPRGIVLIK
ncbi:PKD domain-containing protein [Flagellimonas iocasae]|uniref:PKD domain-containing protein n=1 Tax=Flagellimonas iocasae TaxID=2055905 RepID=A0ABW4Y189_9FLAO